MDADEKKAIKDAQADTADIEKIEADIKSSFKTILFVVGFILLILIGLWVYAVFFADDTYTTTTGVESQYEYNGFPFVKNGNLWQTQFFKQTALGPQQYDILVYYSPKELEDIPIESGLYKEIFDVDEVLLALNESALQGNQTASEAAVAAIELGKIVGTRYNILNKRTSSGVISPFGNETGENPIISCDMVEANETAVVVFAIANQTGVYKSDNGCIYVVGETGLDIVKSADRFMYQIAGVMRE